MSHIIITLAIRMYRNYGRKNRITLIDRGIECANKFSSFDT